MIEIYDRQEIKNDVPISHINGLWACHISNKSKYNIKARPITTFDTLKEVVAYFKSQNLDVFGCRD